MSSDVNFLIAALGELFSGLRYTRYRTNAKTGKLDANGKVYGDASIGLTPPYIWVRFGDDRAAVPVLSKIRNAPGLDVVVAFDRLLNEDVVLEVNLARAVLSSGTNATAFNVPNIPASLFTPVSAHDVEPGALRAESAIGGLNARILPTWIPGGGWWDGSTLIAVAPTATSSSKSFCCVGIDPADSSVVTGLTTDRALSVTLLNANREPTPNGAADIKAVTDAQPDIWWVGAVLLANGDTSIDPAKIADLRFWDAPIFAGADGSNAGAAGLVPAPAATDNTKVLFGSGSWGDAPGAGGAAASVGAYASARPSSPATGAIYIVTDAPWNQEVYDGANWRPMFNGALLTIPPAAGWTWDNMGGATIDYSLGAPYLYVPAGTSTNSQRLLYRSAPTPPYTITALFRPNVMGINNPYFAFGFRESSSGKLHCILVNVNVANLQIYSGKYTDSTHYLTEYTSSQRWRTDNIWLQISDNNTNRILRISGDGKNWTVFHSVSRTDYLTANQVFFGLSPANATFDSGLTLMSWEES